MNQNHLSRPVLPLKRHADGRLLAPLSEAHLFQQHGQPRADLKEMLLQKQIEDEKAKLARLQWCLGEILAERAVLLRQDDEARQKRHQELLKINHLLARCRPRSASAPPAMELGHSSSPSSSSSPPPAAACCLAVTTPLRPRPHPLQISPCLHNQQEEPLQYEEAFSPFIASDPLPSSDRLLERAEQQRHYQQQREEEDRSSHRRCRQQLSSSNKRPKLAESTSLLKAANLCCGHSSLLAHRPIGLAAEGPQELPAGCVNAYHHHEQHGSMMMRSADVTKVPYCGIPCQETSLPPSPSPSTQGSESLIDLALLKGALPECPPAEDNGGPAAWDLICTSRKSSLSVLDEWIHNQQDWPLGQQADELYEDYEELHDCLPTTL